MSDDESSDVIAVLIAPSPEDMSAATAKRTQKVHAGESRRKSSRRLHPRTRLLFLGCLGCMAAVLTLAVAVGLGVGLSRSSSKQDPVSRAKSILTTYPVIDGLAIIFSTYKYPHGSYHSSLTLFYRHNDLAYQLRLHFQNQLNRIDLLRNTTGEYGPEWQTDIPRLREGRVGGQVQSAVVTQPDIVHVFLTCSSGLHTCHASHLI